jgi:hypothetical protein
MVDLSCLLRKDEIYGARLLKEYVEIYSSDDPFEIKLGLNYSDEIHKLLSKCTYLCRLLLKSNKYNKYLSSMIIEDYEIVGLNDEELMLSASLPIRVACLKCTVKASCNIEEKYDLMEMLPQISNAKKIKLEFCGYKFTDDFLKFARENEWMYEDYSTKIIKRMC